MLIVQLIVIHILTFATLVFVLRKIMISTSYAETKRLQQLSRESAQKAHELAGKIKEADRQCTEKISAAEKEAQRLKFEAQEEAKRVKVQMFDEAKKEKEQLIKQTVNAKEKIREEIAQEMRSRAIEFSRRLIQEALSQQSRQLLHESFVKEIFDDLGKVNRDVFDSVNAEQPVEVFTAAGLPSLQKQKLTKVLLSCSGHNVNVKETVQGDLIAGMTLKWGNIIIDGSLGEKIKKAAQGMAYN